MDTRLDEEQQTSAFVRVDKSLCPNNGRRATGTKERKTGWKTFMMLLLSSKRVFPTGNHERALETHIRKAKAAGVTDEEITHTVLLLISTTGFPIFMKAYSVLKSVRRV